MTFNGPAIMAQNETQQRLNAANAAANAADAKAQRLTGLKAHDTYTGDNGEAYIILSVRNGVVEAYTYDLSEEMPNGKVNGKKVHFEKTIL
jgi:hypothetical protein